MVSLLAFTDVIAWDTNGHWIVSLIAGSMMSDRAEKFIKESIETKAQDIPRSLAFASIWADMILSSDPSYEWSRNLHFAFSDPHCSGYKENRDCPDGRCIVTALANYTMRAAEFSLPLKERREAVKFLIHFMADIHQPLHIGFMKDEGGTKIFLNDPPTTLHNVWDEALFTEHLNEHAPSNTHRIWNYYAVSQDLLNEIETEIGRTKKLKRFFSPADVTSRQAILTSIEKIANETSSRLTCNIAYKHVDGSLILQNDDLDDDYMKSRVDFMLVQFKRAGVRLAHLLDVVAGRYFEKKDAACALKRKEMEARRTTVSPQKSSNLFIALQGADCDSDAEESLVGSLTEEDILEVEKTILFQKESSRKKASKKKTKLSKSKSKSVSEMSNKEFDDMLAEFVAQSSQNGSTEVSHGSRKVKRSAKLSKTDD